MKQLLISAIVCILFFLNGCMKKVAPPDVKFVNVDRETSSLRGEINSKDTIYITSNDQWTVVVESGIDWLSVQPMSGSGDGMIVITTTKHNNSGSRKTTNIELKAVNGSQSRLITVTQLQYTDILLNVIFGGDGHDVFADFTTTPDGGYIAAGTSSSTQGDGTGAKGGQDFWVVKFNSNGQKVWHKKFGGSQDEVANTIIRTGANNYMVLGTSLSSDGDVTAHKGERDAWLISIDGDGNLLWEKSIGGSGAEQLYHIKPSNDGHYIMAGWTYSNDGDISFLHGDADAWIVKVNDQGDIMSEKTYGGSKEDIAYDVTPVSDGGYIFCGKLQSMDGDASDRTVESYAAWFVKLNAAGNLAGKIYLGESAYDYGTVALEAYNGDYLFAGETNTAGAFDNFHGARDAFVLRVDAGGNIIWKKAYGGGQHDEPNDLIETNDGNFIFAGSTMSADGDIANLLGGEDAWVMKLNGDGDVIGNTTFGGTSDDNITRIKQIGNYSFAFTGVTDSFDDGYENLPDGMHGWFEIINF